MSTWGFGSKRSSWLPGTLLMLAVVFLVFYLRTNLPVEQWLGPARDWVDQFGASAAFVLGIGIMLATPLGMPGSVMAIIAGLALGLGQGMLVTWLGISAGSSLCFLLSRWIFGKHVNAIVAQRPHLVAVRQAVLQRGWPVLLLLRLTPLVPMVVMNYVGGVSGVRLPHALLATAVGIMPATLVYVGVGAAGHSDPKTSGALVAIGVVATIGLGIVARRILGEVLAA